jgi:hypothetical protein
VSTGTMVAAYAVICGVLLQAAQVYGITAAERTYILNYHNNLRQALANGNTANKDGVKLPSAANMNRLVYDAGIETNAQTYVNGCSQQVRTYEQRNRTGEMRTWFNTAYENSTTDALRIAADGWSSQLAKYGVSTSLNLTQAEWSTGIGLWATMVWAESAKMACGVRRCPANAAITYSYTYVVCQYSPGTAYNKLIYEKGTPCSKCQTASTCSSPLCMPSNATYSVGPMSAADRTFILNFHNNLRQEVAKGNTPNKDGVKLPTAANMNRLSYDMNLEALAQNWANQCTTVHSTEQQRNGTGENLYYTTASNQNTLSGLTAAANWWSSELASYGVNTALNFTKAEFDKTIGHWTNMVWAKTTKVGCAVKLCPANPANTKVQTEHTYVVCNYSPAGNWLNWLIYEKGTPCSKCQSGSTCSSPLCLTP